MKFVRTTPIMAALVLAGLAGAMPAAQAEESSDEALKRQLEKISQQLRELQLRVQRIEAEHGVATPPPSGHAVTSPPAQNTPAPPAASARTAPVPSQAGGVAPVVPSAPAGIASTGTRSSPAAPAPPAAGTSPPPVVTEALQWHDTLKAQWRSVKAGMSDEQIRQLLGAPSREFTLDGRPIWYYTYPGIGNGSVLFNRDGHTVAGSQHPPFGFW
jgi:hypothetical protein